MVLGVDLGTTYSAAAYVDDNDEMKVVVNAEGERRTPSVVLEEAAGNIVVGEVAKENAMIRAKDVVSVVKNHMGTKKKFVLFSGKEYTPEEISSLIIRKIVKDAESYSGNRVSDVIITVPAYFDNAQRKATEDAAKLAGINLLGFINEPTAAILGYVKRKQIENGIFMVYDLGGGTFDVSIVKVDGENIDVIGKDGLLNSGGHFFDMKIVDYVCDYFREKYDIDLEDEEYRDDYQELVNKAETAKIQLSAKNSTSIIMKIGKIRENVEITRENFEGMIKSTYRNTETKMKKAMRDANVTAADIDSVLMVGGSSRIPYIEEKVREFIGKEPAKDINPDEAVAVGAALFGKIRSTHDKKNVFHDTNSHSIGFIYMRPDRTKENRVLIRKNVQLPAEYVEDKMATNVDNQEKINLQITEGESADVDAVNIISELEIKLPKNLPTKTNVIVKYELNEYQLLHVYVNIPSVPNFNFEQKLDWKSNLTDEEISTMLVIMQDMEVN